MSDFITKDSGKREEYSTGMVRDTQDGKANFYLCMPKGMPYKLQLLTRWAELMERGRVKYGMRNWENARTEEELERFKASAARHFMQWINDEDDEDHAAAVLFNINAAEYVKWRQLFNDFEEAEKPWKCETKDCELCENNDLFDPRIWHLMNNKAICSEYPWNEEDHFDALSDLYTHNNVPSVDEIQDAYLDPTTSDVEQLVVEYHPDYAWVWE